jgi:hypothetical protein
MPTLATAAIPDERAAALGHRAGDAIADPAGIDIDTAATLMADPLWTSPFHFCRRHADVQPRSTHVKLADAKRSGATSHACRPQREILRSHDDFLGIESAAVAPQEARKRSDFDVAPVQEMLHP